MVKRKPTVISTFAGCGGSSLGYKMAGFHELLAVEWDDNAVETFKTNFPDVPVYHKGWGRQVFRGMLADFRAAGYNVHAEVMNSMYFGVAQSRQRVIVIGVRKDIKVWPNHPRPYTSPISFSSAIRGISPSMESLAEARKVVSTQKCRDMMAKIRQGENGSKYHPKGHWFGFARVSAGRPIRTIPKTLFPGANNMIHPTEDRNLTVEEYKACSSFPPDFVFVGKMVDAVARIGNSVPPLLMKAIAEHIKKEILQKV